MVVPVRLGKKKKKKVREHGEWYRRVFVVREKSVCKVLLVGHLYSQVRDVLRMIDDVCIQAGGRQFIGWGATAVLQALN